MVKAEIKTPNKRKSIVNDTPAKKAKVENGSGKPFTPKKQGGSPQKFNKNKPGKAENDSDVKDIKAFAGTKQLKQKPNQKPQNEKFNKNKSVDGKKKKARSQFGNLLSQVKEKEGSKDAELLKSIQEKINAINERGELTKTAKKKLGRLMKMKMICEEGAEAAAAKNRAKVAAEKAASEKNKLNKAAAKPAQAAQQQQKKKQPAVAKGAPQKKPAAKPQEEDDEDNSDAEEDESDEEGGEEADSDDDDAGEEDDSGEEVEGEDDDDDEEDDDDSEEEAPPAPKETKKSTQNNQRQEQQPNLGNKGPKNPTIQELKNKDLVKTGQKRYVLFVGNIAYDTSKQEIAQHFSKAGDILHIRIPTDQKTNKPRGFAYLELKDEVSYEKCLSMHHSQFKSRRINVLYTQGGKKKGDQQKKEIKAKNMKLHAMRRQGQLAGSVKQTQKRTFRRNKGKLSQKQGEQQD